MALEQNYRSTNAILGAANAVIECNRDRKPKRLWSELGEGDPVEVVEVEDEHAEARFVAAEIARLVESGYSAAEIAVFYRTNAQSRVLEDVLVRQGVPYQVIGGPRFYERAEIKDAAAYLSLLNNPDDAVALMRIANRPRRGRHERTRRGAVGRVDRERTRDPASDDPSSRSCRRAGLAAHEPERVLERSGTIEAYEAERTIEAAVGRTLSGARRLTTQEYRARGTSPCLGVPEGAAPVDQDTLAEDTAQVTLMTITTRRGSSTASSS